MQGGVRAAGPQAADTHPGAARGSRPPTPFPIRSPGVSQRPGFAADPGGLPTRTPGRIDAWHAVPPSEPPADDHSPEALKMAQAHAELDWAKQCPGAGHDAEVGAQVRMAQLCSSASRSAIPCARASRRRPWDAQDRQSVGGSGGHGEGGAGGGRAHPRRGGRGQRRRRRRRERSASAAPRGGEWHSLADRGSRRRPKAQGSSQSEPSAAQPSATDPAPRVQGVNQDAAPSVTSDARAAGLPDLPPSDTDIKSARPRPWPPLRQKRCAQGKRRHPGRPTSPRTLDPLRAVPERWAGWERGNCRQRAAFSRTPMSRAVRPPSRVFPNPARASRSLRRPSLPSTCRLRARTRRHLRPPPPGPTSHGTLRHRKRLRAPAPQEPGQDAQVEDPKCAAPLPWWAAAAGTALRNFLQVSEWCGRPCRRRSTPRPLAASRTSPWPSRPSRALRGLSPRRPLPWKRPVPRRLSPDSPSPGTGRAVTRMRCSAFGWRYRLWIGASAASQPRSDGRAHPGESLSHTAAVRDWALQAPMAFANVHAVQLQCVSPACSAASLRSSLQRPSSARGHGFYDFMSRIILSSVSEQPVPVAQALSSLLLPPCASCAVQIVTSPWACRACRVYKRFHKLCIRSMLCTSPTNYTSPAFSPNMKRPRGTYDASGEGGASNLGTPGSSHHASHLAHGPSECEPTSVPPSRASVELTFETHQNPRMDHRPLLLRKARCTSFPE